MGAVWLLVVLLGDVSIAADAPSLYVRDYLGLAMFPSGVVNDLVLETRTPILRYGGAVFNDTFAGVGGRVAVSPAHADIALRASVQPVDILPVTVELTRSFYWISPWGLVPLEASSVGRTSARDRQPLYDAGEDFAGASWGLMVAPTLQARYGPVVAFSSWTVTRWWMDPPPGVDTPMVWELYRGQAVFWSDTLVEHTSAVLAEYDRGDGLLLRAGPALRGLSATTGDRTLTLGGVVQLDPGPAVEIPTFLLLCAAYLEDPDFVGGPPFVALLSTWELDQPYRR